ncbi:MAG TPA: hypothetical protein VG965_07035 [Patescibacteria group bacterium]|nr:hypothetical protein [Patescibacteria group bacterium]
MQIIKHVPIIGKERGSSNPDVQDLVKYHQPILYLGRHISDFKKHGLDPDTIEEFRKNGFKIREANHDQGNELRVQDLGFMTNPNLLEATRTEILSDAAGVDTPREVPFEEVLLLPGPYVAKDVREDRGESVQYLRGRENISKFLIWNYIFYMPSDLDPKKVLERRDDIPFLKEVIRLKKWNWSGFKYLKPGEGWQFQEFVDSPSNHYTSFRVLADGYGNIHYSTLIRSPEEKGIRKNTDPRPNEDFNPTFKHLRDPNGTLYIPSPNIVSNTAQGGIRIQLDGNTVTDPINREVLSAHGIDPDNPRLPEKMTEKAKLIAVASRTGFPYVGIDFMYDKKFNLYFLEANSFPTLSADGLGISEIELRQRVRRWNNRDEVQKYLRKVLIKRIVEATFSQK